MVGTLVRTHSSRVVTPAHPIDPFVQPIRSLPMCFKERFISLYRQIHIQTDQAVWVVLNIGIGVVAWVSVCKGAVQTHCLYLQYKYMYSRAGGAFRRSRRSVVHGITNTISTYVCGWSFIKV